MSNAQSEAISEMECAINGMENVINGRLRERLRDLSESFTQRLTNAEKMQQKQLDRQSKALDDAEVDAKAHRLEIESLLAQSEWTSFREVRAF